MKFVSWILATSMVLPTAYANPGYSQSTSQGVQTLPAVQMVVADANKLNLNNGSNFGIQDHLKKQRENLSKNHKKLGSTRDAIFRDMSKDYNLLNPQSGMTFWEEWTELQNGDEKTLESKYANQSLLFRKLGTRLKGDLILFMTWLRANALSTFKSLLANDPDGILELEKLKISDAPYKIDGPTYVVSRHKDVVKALSNPELFSVRNYHQRMKDSVGNFMLGNDKTAFNEEHEWLRQFLKREEMETRIRPMVKQILNEELKKLEYIKKNPKTGQLEANIDVVNHIARRVPAILTIRYFGFEGKKMTPEKIMEWSRATQDDFFHNIVGDAEKAKVAIAAGQEMQAELVSLVNAKFKNIEQLKQIPSEKQTVLDRMVMSIGAIDASMSVDDLLAQAKDKVYLKKANDEVLENLSSTEIVNRIKGRIRTNIIGTLVGGLETTQAAITQPLNLILGDKDLSAQAKGLAAKAMAAQAAAREAVKAGQPFPRSITEQTQFDNFIWEVLRFHPVNPVVFRYVEKDTELSGVKLKAHSHIIIATQAAMFDSEVFKDPESIILNRFQSFHKDGYFHLGFGHHRCLGDYVSMIQVPEIIAGILSLPGVRRMGGAFGELDFNQMIKRDLIGGDKFDSSFPERMILEYDSSAERPLEQKTIEIADQDVPWEGYLRDYDRIHFRGCMSGWNIIQDKDGKILYSKDGSTNPLYYPKDPRFQSNVSDFIGDEGMLKAVRSDIEKKKKGIFFSSAIRASQGYASNLQEENSDLIYCRLPMKFHVCFESESDKVEGVLGKDQKLMNKLAGESKLHAFAKSKWGSKSWEIRNRTETGDPRMTSAHKTIFNKCSSFAELTETEKAFYENVYFDKEIDKDSLSTEQAKRPAMWDKDFWYEDYFSAQYRYYYRGSFANPLGWSKMEETNKIDFYVRLNFNFRTCVGEEIKKNFKKSLNPLSKIIKKEVAVVDEEVTSSDRCNAYRKCLGGTYNPLTFRYEGALSGPERKAYNEIVVADDPCEK